MAGQGPLKVGIIGCGNISKGYATTMTRDGKVQIVGAYDMARDRAEAFTREFGGRVYDTMDALLSDPDIEAIVNLTIQQAHYDVVRKCLEAGKHVHTEKPLSLDNKHTADLVKLAAKKKLRLSTAPATHLGEAQQTTWKIVRNGQLGTVRVVYAEMNHGRIESWHPNPEAFYVVGPLFDVGVYPLTVLTTLFGPVAQVDGFERALWPQRQTLGGQTFQIQAPDWSCGILDFESGILGRLTTNFYVGPTKQAGIEIHGDTASLYLASSVEPHAQVQMRPFNVWEWSDVPLIREPWRGYDWGRGVVELGEAIREDRPHRATGEQAAHVVEIINGIHKAATTGRAVPIKSRFTPPPPMEWAR